MRKLNSSLRDLHRLTESQADLDLDLLGRQHIHLLRSSKLVLPLPRRQSAKVPPTLHEEGCTDLLLRLRYGLPTPLLRISFWRLSSSYYLVRFTSHWRRSDQLHRNVHHIHPVLSSLPSARTGSKDTTIHWLPAAVLRILRTCMDVHCVLHLRLHLIPAMECVQLLLQLHHAAVHSSTVLDLEVHSQD